MGLVKDATKQLELKPLTPVKDLRSSREPRQEGLPGLESGRTQPSAADMMKDRKIYKAGSPRLRRNR